MTERRYPDPATTTPERVLMIQAHPDDAEFSIGGTMAKWAADGAEIIYCSITSGDKGTRDPEITGEALITTREQQLRSFRIVFDCDGPQFNPRFARWIAAAPLPQIINIAYSTSPDVEVSVALRKRPALHPVPIEWDEIHRLTESWTLDVAAVRPIRFCLEYAEEVHDGLVETREIDGEDDPLLQELEIWPHT